MKKSFQKKNLKKMSKKRYYIEYMNVIIIIVVLIFILFGSLYKSFVPTFNFTQNSELDNIIKILLRQTARWAVASEQDESPLISVLHANYAAGYLWALKDIATTEQIRKTTGQNLLDIEKRVTNIQDKATRKMVKACPSYAGDVDKVLGKIGGDI